MSLEQRDFYLLWLRNWNNGVSIDIDGQYSYLFCYMLELIKQREGEALAEELLILRSSYPAVDKNSEGFHTFCNAYIADAYVQIGDYGRAIETLSSIELSDVHPITRNKLLSLKLFVGWDITGKDFLSLFGAPWLTGFGKSNLSGISETLDAMLADFRGRIGTTFLANMVVEYYCCEKPTAYPMFGYHNDAIDKFPGIPYRYFHTTPKAYPFADEMIREAENLFRENSGIPRIGEGWVSETELYYRIKEAFSDLDVQHHASPKWLGRQHLDIFLPELNKAIEFQGQQHDAPVDFFGGEQAFQQTQERDTRKQKLCKKNGVRLIYVRPGYKIDEVIRLVRE